MTWAVPDWWTFVLLALAAWRTFRLLGEDTILHGPRARLAPEGSKREELLTCPYCLGAYLSAGVWLLWVWQPHWTLVGCTPLALSATVALVETKLGD